MPILHTWCFGMAIFRSQRRVHRGRRDGVQHFQGHPTGAIDDNLVPFETNDSGFQTNLARTPIDDRLDTAVHIVEHVLCGGRAGAGGNIRTGPSNRNPGGPNQSSCSFTSRTANRNGRQSPRCFQGNDILLRKYNGQWSRPEGFHQFFCQRAHGFYIFPHFRRVCYVNNERIV